MNHSDIQISNLINNSEPMKILTFYPNLILAPKAITGVKKMFYCSDSATLFSEYGSGYTITGATFNLILITRI